MKGSVKGSIRGPLRALQRALLGVLLGLISGGVNVWNRGFKSGCTPWQACNLTSEPCNW